MSKLITSSNLAAQKKGKGKYSAQVSEGGSVTGEKRRKNEPSIKSKCGSCGRTKRQKRTSEDAASLAKKWGNSLDVWVNKVINPFFSKVVLPILILGVFVYVVSLNQHPGTLVAGGAALWSALIKLIGRT